MKTSLKNLATFLDVPPDQLGAMIFHGELFYKEVAIPKRRGGVRKLNVPNSLLRVVQRKIYRNILGKFQAHEAAQAYVKKKSIITNATQHIESVFMLKMDIENFFGCVQRKLVIDKFIQIAEVFDKQRSSNSGANLPRFTDKECEFLSNLCTLNGTLPQGAITSPHLSNLIFYKIDEAIMECARKVGAKYTRYSDDMIFTAATDQVFEIENFVREKMEHIGLKVNEKKIVKLNDGDGKYVTGLSINNGKVRVAKNRRREIRQEYYEYTSNKIEGLDSSAKNLSKASLMGKLEFWRYVEPNCDFAKKAISVLEEI